MMNFANNAYNPYQQPAQAPYQQAQAYPYQQPAQAPAPYYPVAPGYYPPAQPAETGWQKAGRIALDLVKIGVAVAGGVAVYKLVENYFGEDDCCAACAAAATESSKSALYSGREEVFDD